MVESISENRRRSQGQKGDRKVFSYPEHRQPRLLRSKPLTHYGRGGSEQAKQHYVFIYNDLKKGCSNKEVLDRATVLGDFRTLERFSFVNSDTQCVSTLADSPQVGQHVKGKLYAVDSALLSDLDYLAQAGVSANRKITKVSSCQDRSFVVDAYVYFQFNCALQMGAQPNDESHKQRLLRYHRKSAFRSSHLMLDQDAVASSITDSLPSRSKA